MLRWYRGFVDRLAVRSTRKRNFQEEVDTHRLAVAAAIHKQWSREPDMPQEALEALVEATGERMANMAYMNKRLELVDLLHEQALGLLRHTHAKGGVDPYPRPKSKLAVPAHVASEAQGAESLAEEALELHVEEETKRQEAEVEDRPLEHPGGFTMRINYSGIHHPDAGFGVWLEGRAMAGTLLAFYPGRVHLAPAEVEKVAPGNEYLMSRYDGAVVDGRGWAQEAVRMRRKLRHLAAMSSGMAPPQEEEMSKFRNPFAIANYVNHPAPGSQPNVMCCSYDFPPIGVQEDGGPRRMPEKLFQYVPNMYESQPSARAAWLGGGSMRGVAMVAVRPIEDEELLLNYRFNPRNPYPPWYAQPCEEEAARRWGSVL